MTDEQDRESTQPEADEAQTAHEEQIDEVEEEAAPRPEPKLERLQKILAAAGIAILFFADKLSYIGYVALNFLRGRRLEPRSRQVVLPAGTAAPPGRHPAHPASPRRVRLPERCPARA